MALVIRALLPSPLYLHRRLTNVSCLRPLLSTSFVFSFVSVSVLGARFQTPVCKRTLSPVFTAKDATFDFPIYPSLSEKLGALEFVVWDKDVLRKEYLGEFALPLDEWFRGNAFDFEDLNNQVRRFLQSPETSEISHNFL